MKKFCIFLTILFFCLPIFAQFGGVPQSKVKSNYSWSSPKPDDMTFFIASIDGKQRTFFLQIDDFFVPIKSAPVNTLGEKFVLKKSKSIKLYDRKVEDGVEIFPLVGTIETKDFSDFACGIYVYGDELKSGVVDLSLENMPVGTMNIVNFQPITMGVLLNKKASAIKMFEHYKRLLRNDKGRFLFAGLETFDLRNPSAPRSFYSLSFRFPKDERAITFVMGLRKTGNAMNNRDMEQFFEMSNKSPR